MICNKKEKCRHSVTLVSNERLSEAEGLVSEIMGFPIKHSCY